MKMPVKILLVEDSEDDAKLALRALRRGGFEPKHLRVQTAAELQTSLAQEHWDAVISDFNMPGFTGNDALRIFRATNLDIPFILISGTVGEETAVNMMKAGASDYIMKGSLARLAPALERELQETQTRAAHRQAQRDLVQSEQRLRTIIEAEPECVKVVSKEGLLLEMNAAGLVMLEAGSLAAAQSQPLLDFVVPGYRAAFTALFKRVMRGEKGILEFELIGLKGGRRWLETHAAPMSGANGEGTMLLGITRDITERKQAEGVQARLAMIIENSNDAIIGRSLDGTVTSWNAGAERLYGYTAAEAVGKAGTFLTPPELRHETERNRELLRQGVLAPPHETLRLTKDGRRLTVMITVSPIKDHSGNIVGMSSITRDITERVRTEERQRRQITLARLQSAIAAAVNEAATLEQAMRASMAHICNYGGWALARAGTFASGGKGTAQSVWHCPQPAPFGELIELSNRYSYSGRASGQFVAEAMRERKPVWVSDLATAPHFGRLAVAAKCGIHAGLVFPIAIGDEVAGFLEFFATEAREPDALFLEAVDSIGSQLARIIERARASEGQVRLAAIVESSPDAIMSSASDGTALTWNAGAEKLFGYASAEVIGQKLSNLIVPEDLREDTLRHTQRYLSGGDLVPFESERLTKDGRRIAVSVNTSLLKEKNGNIIGLATIFHDITKRKQTEQRLQQQAALLDLAHVAIVVRDSGDAVTFWSRGAERLYGWSVAQALGQRSHELLHTQFLVPLAQIEQELLQHDNWQGELVHTCKDGSRITVDSRWAVQRDAQNRVTGILEVNSDVTERKQAGLALLRLNEELEDKVTARTVELQRARCEAEEANNAKSMFLATMSHEIRTPMNGVIGMIDVLHQTSLRGEQVEMVDLIRESAFSLLGIINDILDFSKIEAGKMEIEREAISVADLTEGVSSLLNGMADKKDVALLVYVDPAIPAQVLGDGLRLRQVLTNLVNNAIKFSSGQSRAGRVSIRALLVERSAEQLTVEFRVTDNGVGMDEETLTRLFTAFNQADVSTTRRYGGTGLGLAIVKHLVQLMAGEITAQSAPGAGSTFKVLMPFVALPAKSSTDDATSEVAGLSCVVVGVAGGLADDLASYLEHARAAVERAEDLKRARVQTAGWNGLSVWIVDASDEPQRMEQMRVVARTQAGRDVDFVVVVIERGKRRRPRVVAPGLITIDGNALRRRTFLKAVAAAAGRASLETEADAALTTPRKLAAIAPSREVAVLRGTLILIAEDNETNQKVILRQLALLGYAADIAADGREALECWHSGDYALLLTDLHMPRMDGYELTAAIRAAEQDGTRIPIIALTANALKNEAEHCRAAGMDDYRSKPSPLAELKAVLDKWLPAAQSAPDAARSSNLPPAPTQQAATAAPVDVNALKELVGDDPELVHGLLRDFRASAATITLELRAACATNQPTAAVAAAHKLKSSARAVGAFALGELCEAMETEGKTGDADALAVLLPRFEAEMAVVDAYLSKIHATFETNQDITW